MADKVQLKLSHDITIPDIPPKFKSKYQKWRHEANYKKAEDSKCCKTCINCVNTTGSNRVFYKCNIQGISHSAATDIRLSCVCDYYREGKSDG